MAGRKNNRSSKTDHVLSLLSNPPQDHAQQETQPAPPPPAAPVQETPPAEPPAAPPEQLPRETRLSPPILEVARANNEALEETIHSALEDALLEHLDQEAAPPEPVLQPAPEPTPVPVPESEPELIPESAPEAELESVPVPAPEQEAEPMPEQEADPEPTPVPTPASEPDPIPEPVPETVPEPPQPASAHIPDPDENYIALPDGSRFTNVMFILVEEKLERYVKLFHLCDCPRCLADAKALALSRLPAKYVVLPGTAYPPMMNLYRAKYDSMVTAQVVYACKQILDAPRHQG